MGTAGIPSSQVALTTSAAPVVPVTSGEVCSCLSLEMVPDSRKNPLLRLLFMVAGVVCAMTSFLSQPFSFATLCSSPPVQLASALPRLLPQRRFPTSICRLQFLMKTIKQVAFCTFDYKERFCACKNVQNVQPVLKNHGHQ